MLWRLNNIFKKQNKTKNDCIERKMEFIFYNHWQETISKPTNSEEADIFDKEHL